MKTQALFLAVWFVFPALWLSAQHEFKATDFSRQINLPDNQGTVNINQYLGKSDDYKALTQQLSDLELALKEKQVDCDAFASAGLTERHARCLQAAAALNAKKDSMSGVIDRFKEDVIRLARTFESEKDNSALFRQARTLFEAGKFREANTLLDVNDLSALGEEGLEKAQTAARLFHIKALTKALDYADPLRIDSTAFCYRRSLRYADNPAVLYDMAVFFYDNHVYDSAFAWFPVLAAHHKAEAWQVANAYSYLGDLHTATGNLPAAMTYYEKLLAAAESLAKEDTDFKQRLCIAYERFGSTHTALGNLSEALTFFETQTTLFEELHAAFPQNVYFKNGLAISYWKLSTILLRLGKLDESRAKCVVFQNMSQDLAVESPTTVEYQANIAIAKAYLNGLAILLGSRQDRSDIISAISVLEKIVANTGIVYYQKKVAIIHKMARPDSDLKSCLLELTSF
ncbi:MAG: tetratricopeptide repeat protein [Saprospiraceae bacterium]|nr:tetratricopeptide repeat protein [Saprospiraceae bacterium]